MVEAGNDDGDLEAECKKRKSGALMDQWKERAHSGERRLYVFASEDAIEVQELRANAKAFRDVRTIIRLR